MKNEIHGDYVYIYIYILNRRRKRGYRYRSYLMQTLGMFLPYLKISVKKLFFAFFISDRQDIYIYKKKRILLVFPIIIAPLDRQCTHRGVHRDSTREIPLKNVVSSFGFKFSLLMVLEIP